MRKSTPTMIFVSSFALVPLCAMGNVVQVTGSLAAGPFGSPIVAGMNTATLLPFTASNAGISISGTSGINNSTAPSFALAIGGFSETTISVTSTSAVDFTITGQYEFDLGSPVIQPATFTDFIVSGTSRGRLLRLSYFATVDGVNLGQQSGFQTGLQFPFGFSVTTPTMPVAVTPPTATMSISLRVEVGAGSEAVEVSHNTLHQKLVWQIPSPGVASVALAAGLSLARRRSR